MKYLLLTFYLTFATLFAVAQDSLKLKRNQDFFLGISNFSPLEIGLNYKIQLKNKTYFKIGFINFHGNYQKNTLSDTRAFPTSRLSLNGGISLGLERRTVLLKYLTLYHGVNLFYTRNFQKNYNNNPALTESQRTINSTTGFGGFFYSLGVLTKITPCLFVALELNPAITIENPFYESHGYGRTIGLNFEKRIFNLFVVLRR